MLDLAEKIVLAAITFVFMGVAGNFLVQRWQARNWMTQQRVLGQEKEYVALKELVEEIGVLLGARIYHMQRFAMALRSDAPDAVDSRANEHDEVVKRWNERLASFYVRLPLLIDATMGNRFESSFQDPFASISAQLSELRTHSTPAQRKKEAGEAMHKLNQLQGRSIRWNKELVRVVNARRLRIYFGEHVAYKSETIHRFSNLELIKALFISDVDSHTVLRTPIDT